MKTKASIPMIIIFCLLMFAIATIIRLPMLIVSILSKHLIRWYYSNPALDAYYSELKFSLANR